MDDLLGAGRYHDRAVYPVPQVILLDLKMPRVNGFELLHWLRHESPGDLRLLPIVIMSSSDMEEDVRRAYALGANSYLVKPIDWKSFDERMQALGIYWAQHVQKPTEAVQ
jgi:CheY-like chemotaxis protein